MDLAFYEVTKSTSELTAQCPTNND